jgi:hypothetical protein
MPFDENNAIELEFYNATAESKVLWVELACVEITLDAQTEYKIVSDDKMFRLEFREKMIILYLQTRFGFKLYRRDLARIDSTTWVLDTDLSDIN